ncbi:MAG: TetR/AcrR family transcriptional regulator [Pseudomonadota bacterium]
MDEKKSRQSWLDAGLQALADSGPQGLRIMPIAAQLGVTKGSFYWHFKDLQEYELALLQEWEHNQTQHAIASVEKTGGDAHARLRNLFTGASGIASVDFALSRAMRTWSLTHESARLAQAAVDQKRLLYLARLLRDVGWSKGEAETLARWTYGALIGLARLDVPAMTPKQLALIVKTLTPDPADACA